MKRYLLVYTTGQKIVFYAAPENVELFQKLDPKLTRDAVYLDGNLLHRQGILCLVPWEEGDAA